MTSSRRIVRIGNAQAFWGDRPDAAIELLTQEPDLDYLTMDYLAEVSMSILAVQRDRDPEAGYARDFVDVVHALAGYWSEGGQCRLITNAGGLNPLGCARACRRVLDECGCRDIRIAIVTGDNVLARLKATHQSQSPDPGASADVSRLSSGNDDFRNVDSGVPIESIRERLVTANAYLGAAPIVEALAAGADLVITGRVADPSLVVAPCQFEFGWSDEDWDALAGATVAGHLIECGTQVTGGNATDWLNVPQPGRMGFPIVEVAQDGSCTVTLPRRAGGMVSEATVREQLLYEIGDPGSYLSPDVTVSFLTLHVMQEGRNRVHVTGATGRPRPQTCKVSATYRDGWRSSGQLTVVGQDCVEKAVRAGQMIVERITHASQPLRDSVIECLGSGVAILGNQRITTISGPPPEAQRETVLRIAVEAGTRPPVERFSRELMSLITAGPPGTTGYADGRPRVHEIFRYWPCLISMTSVPAAVQILEAASAIPAGGASVRRVQAEDSATNHPETSIASNESGASEQLNDAPEPGPSTIGTLAHIAIARSGDKGTSANVGVTARKSEFWEQLRDSLTEQVVLNFYSAEGADSVTRYELPNLFALNFVVRGILKRSLRNDAQGKTLAQRLLTLPWPLSDSSS